MTEWTVSLVQASSPSTEMVARNRYANLPIDYVLIPDSETHPDVSRYDLSPANPEASAG